MKRTHKIAKIMLMEMAPIEAYEILEKYKIPTPYKELLEIICIERYKGYKILDKCEKMKQNTEVWSVNDLFMFTDIVKDVSEIHKNISKIHKMKSYAQTLV